MNRISHLSKLMFNWCYWRLLILFPFLRPQNVQIKGKLSMCILSRIAMDKRSTLIINGSLKLKRSKIYLTGSTAIISNDSLFQKSSLVLKESQWVSGINLRVCDYLVRMNASSFKAGDYLCFVKNKYYDAWLLAEKTLVNIGGNVKFQSRINCDNAQLTVGSNVYVNHGTELRCHKGVTIGDNVLISYECLIFDTNTHSTDFEVRRREMENGFPNNTVQTELEQADKKEIFIGNNAWIGMRAAILKGSKIGNNVIVGTYAVVSGTVADDCVAVGNPFVIKTRKKN